MKQLLTHTVKSRENECMNACVAHSRFVVTMFGDKVLLYCSRRSRTLYVDRAGLTLTETELAPEYWKPKKMHYHFSVFILGDAIP